VTISAHLTDSAADTAAAETILRAARALSSVTAEPGRVATVIAEIVLAEIGAEGALAVELDGESFRVEGGAGQLARLAGERFRAENSLAFRAISERRAVLQDSPSPGTAECELARRVNAREVLAAPMFAGGVPVGALIAIRCSDGMFSQRDVTTVARLAELASLAMHNARLLERERQGARGATALANIVHELNQSLEFERVVSIVAEKALGLLGGRASVLTILDGDELVIAATSGRAEALAGKRWPVQGSFTGASLRAGRPLRTTDLRAETTFPVPPRDAAGNSSSAIAAPLLVADRPIGALVVTGEAGRVFTEHDEEMLRALASHGAIAIENSRLYRAAAHTARHAETLSMAAKSLSESVVPGGFFEDLFRVARELLGADGLTVYAVDPERRLTRIMYVAGAGAPLGSGSGARSLEDEITDLPDAGTEGFYSDIRGSDAEHFRRWKPHVQLDDIVAVARLPLMVEGRLRGALTLRWKTSRSFGEDDRILLRDFATQVAIALRNADLIADLDRRAQRFSAVARMQQVISRVELREVYGEVTRSARTAVPQAQAVALLALSADRGTFLPQVIIADEAIAWAGELHPVTVADCAASEAVRRGERITTTAPRRSWPDYVPRLASRPMRSEIAVPMLHGDEPAGVLIVQSDDPHAFSSEDGDVLALLARQAGTAIENARLFEAERHMREIAEAAAEISRVALASQGTDHTARQVLETIDRVVPSPGKALALMDVSGTLLRYVATSGALAPLQHLVVPVEQSATTLISGPAPVVVALSPLMGIREGEVVAEGAMLFPLIAKSRVLGVLWSLPSALDDYSGRLKSLTAPLALAADVLLLDEEERKRREREQTLATAVATMQQPILITGLDRRVLYANAAAVDEYGYTVEEFAGLPLDRLIDSWLPAPRITPDGPALASETWAAEQVHRRKDSTTFPASVLMSAIRDEVGASVGQVVAVRNLTEEQRLQEQLRQSEKLAALGELVAGVAHELNNPLAGISAFAQLMMDDELEDEHRESVRLIKREADRAVGVIRDLLTFSRKAGPTRSLIDVNEMVDLTLRLRGYSLRSAGIDLRVETDPDLPAIPGDDQRLQQVLLNLIVNAEYALQRAECKQLTVRTERAGDGVALYVTDSGVGMAEEVRQRIFEPFFTTKSAGEGTGLGLSVSYGIIRAHGGTITVDSVPGHGTTFRVFLPGSVPAPTTA
jgi:PAS domain S-box-containing protein